MASAASGNVAAVAAVSATAADSSNCSTFLETVQSRQCQQLTHCVTHVESACLALLTEFRQLTEERPAAETKHYRFIHDRYSTAALYCVLQYCTVCTTVLYCVYCSTVLSVLPCCTVCTAVLYC
eukprot:Lankesteria_metandrocarpae@DN4097_c0_g1_i2.p1